jgi:ribosomal protein L23
MDKGYTHDKFHSRLAVHEKKIFGRMRSIDRHLEVFKSRPSVAGHEKIAENKLLLLDLIKSMEHTLEEVGKVEFEVETSSTKEQLEEAISKAKGINLAVLSTWVNAEELRKNFQGAWESLRDVAGVTHKSSAEELT